MTDDMIPLFSFPAIQGKKVTAAFDGGRLSSDGGVMLLSMAERRLGVAERLARCIPDRRDPSRIAHTIADMIRARVFAICCGYEDADDLDVLRCDPAFKLACGRLPDSGRDLCSQPTLSRLENAPGLKDVIRLTYALVDQWMASYATGAALGHARHRRHLRRGARPSAALAVQRPLRRALLSADPCLRHREEPSSRGDPASRQDAVGRRGSRPSAPARAPHPLALADRRASCSAATGIMPGPRR